MFRSTMKLVLGASPLLLAYSTAHLYPSQHEQNEYGSPVVLPSQQHDGIVALQASPQCWTDALQAIHVSSQEDVPQRLSLGTLVCASMSHDHKKALALELARCQMEDAGRLLFEPQNNVTDNCSRPMKSTTVLNTCLAQMTDAGLQVYMHCFTHVHQSCTRLTQERMVQVSQMATEQLFTMLAHQSTMWVQQEERERERDERERERDERDEKLYQEQEQKVLQLTKNVQATAEKMKPLLGIESLITMATHGMTWLTSLIHFLAMMNAVWLLTTLSRRHDATRRFMFRMACTEAFLECIMHWMVLQGILADVDRVRGIGTLRTWTLALECGAYIVGLILSFLFQTPNKKDAAVLNETMLQHLQILNAHAEKLRKEAREREPERVLLETVAPRPLVVVNGHHSTVGNCTETGLVSLPPMYQLNRPDTSFGTTRLDKEQLNVLSYQQVLRCLSAQTPQPFVLFPQETVSSPPRLCEQQEAVYDQSNDNPSNDNRPVKNLRKRLHEVNDDEDEFDEEPERKRLKK